MFPRRVAEAGSGSGVSVPGMDVEREIGGRAEQERVPHNSDT